MKAVVSIAQRTISRATPARKLATFLGCVVEDGHYHLPFQHPTHRERELSLHCCLWPPRNYHLPPLLNQLLHSEFKCHLSMDRQLLRPFQTQEQMSVLVDHWSKFQLAFPLSSKSARDIASALEKWVFSVMELPSILQSNNGCEFVNKVIEEVLTTWAGKVLLSRKLSRVKTFANWLK